MFPENHYNYTFLKKKVFTDKQTNIIKTEEF